MQALTTTSTLQRFMASPRFVQSILRQLYRTYYTDIGRPKVIQLPAPKA